MSNHDDHVFIIAEAGVNHNGDLGLAEKLATCAGGFSPYARYSS